MEPYVEKLCEFLSHTLLTPLVLTVLVDIAIANPASMESHLPLLKQTVEQQPTTLAQVAQIIGAVGNLSEVGIILEEFSPSDEFVISPITFYK